MAEPARLVDVVRSGFVESVHRGSVAVTGGDGRVVAWAGDPELRVNARSCMKPLQAAVTLSLVDDPLSDAEIAVMCASHNGEPQHIQQVEAILRRAGLGSEHLRCPSARPMDPELDRSASGPDRRYHNCSGKHAGMLLACARQGWDPETYRSPEHPLQQRILEAVRTATGEEPSIGVDGCGVPVHAITLRGMATIFARLANPAALGELGGPARRAVAAMRAEPYLVAGRERLDTDAMTTVPHLLVKSGAEGLGSAALLDRTLGIAVKTEDGAHRAVPPVLLRTVEALGGLDADARVRLERYAEPPVMGGEERVGSLVPAFELERA